MKKMFTVIPKGLLVRLLVFVGLFIGVTAIIGPGVVRSRLLYELGFYVYGNMGKVLLLGNIIWVMLVRDKLTDLPEARLSKRQLVWFGVSLVAWVGFMWFKEQLVVYNGLRDSWLTVGGAHASLLLVIVGLFLGIFGLPFVIQLMKVTKKESLITLGLGVVMYMAIFQVWKLWPYLSAGVLASNVWLFSLTHEVVRTFPPRMLLVDGFAVEVAESCSGLDSMFLFSALYLVFGILDWKKFVTWKWLLAFPVALLGLYVVNIVRVYLLILVGVEISAELAWNLFHSYLGMLLFVIYFGVFWKLVYGWMVKESGK